MEDIFAKAEEAANFIRAELNNIPSIGLSLGTGSSNLIDKAEIQKSIPYSKIPYFPTSSVESHVNEFIHAKINGVDVIILGGRMHYYEGWSVKELTFPMRMLQALKVNVILLSNASGALNPGYSAGEIILVKDHINLMPEHPLRGDNDDKLGLRFPDMSEAYSKRLRNIVKESFPDIKEGVYVGYQGPSLETPAEYKMLHTIGADLTGMSTVPEVIVANHASMEVMVLSIATNICYPPDQISETTLEEVIAIANKSGEKLYDYIAAILPAV